MARITSSAQKQADQKKEDAKKLAETQELETKAMSQLYKNKHIFDNSHNPTRK